MKIKYFSISGELGKSEYFKILALLLVEFLVVTSVLSYLMDIQNAEIPGSPIENQVASIVFLTLMLLNFIVLYVVFFCAIIRRARNAGSAVLWTGLSLVFPFMFLLVGFLTKKRK